MRLAVSAPAPTCPFAWPLALSGLGLMALALLLLPPTPVQSPPTTAAGARVQPVSFYDKRTFSLALARAEAEPVAQMPGVRAVIVPHHWLAGHLILGSLRDLAATGAYHRVILIGPDHVNASSAEASTTDLAWQSPFGSLEVDGEAVRQLVAAGLARDGPEVLANEHSIAGLIPAIAYYLPEVRVVPLVLRHGLRPADVQTLASGLLPLLDEGTVIIASVDFSHYLSAQEAAARDRETLAALESLDSFRVLSFGDEHMDSPASMALTMETMLLLGAREFNLTANSNSSELGGPLSPPVTSYIQGYFR